jgi:Condensation domain
VTLDSQSLSPSKAALLARWRDGTVRLPGSEEFIPEQWQGRSDCTLQQRFMWQRQQEYPDLPLHTISYCARFDSAIDVEAFMASAREVFMRHDSLRTRLRSTGSDVELIVDPSPPANPQFVDLCHFDVSVAEQVATEHAERDLLRVPFDMADEPLVRSALYRISDTSHVIAIVAHHAITDGWSLGIALSELDELYRARVEGRPAPLASPALQYRDFARWQRGWLNREGWRADFDYWRERLAGLPPARLPFDRQAPSQRSFRCAGKNFSLSMRQTTMLREFSQREGVSLFMTMLSCWQVLAAISSGVKDATVGVPTLNRRHPQIQGIVGLFMNIVVVRTKISESPTFREVLRSVRDGVLEGLAHQSLDLTLYQQIVDQERGGHSDSNWPNLTEKPLYRTLYVLQPPLKPATLAGAPLRPLELDRGLSIYELALLMWDANPIYGTVQYSVDIFDESSVDKLVDAYFAVIDQVLAHPEIRIADIQS